MTRSKTLPIRQPDEATCGPAALKLALAMLGRRSSVQTLRDLCETNGNGTTTRKMLTAIKKLGLHTLVMQKTTLNHVLGALKTKHPFKKRAVLVSYLYCMDGNTPDPDSGHWAVLSSFRAKDGRIVVLDSYTGKKRSYPWAEFRERWTDTVKKKRKNSKYSRKFHFVNKREEQLMIVLSENPDHLPEFRAQSTRYLSPQRMQGIQ